MSRRHRAPWLILIAAASAIHLGAPCTAPPPDPDPEPVPCTIRIEALTTVPVTETYYVGWADIVIETDKEFQAYDFTLSWDNSALVLTSVSPDPAFDDDGKFSRPVSFQQASGTTSPVLDVRHGPSVTGTTRVATVVFTAPLGLAGSLSVSGAVAAPDGTLLEVAPSDPVTTP